LPVILIFLGVIVIAIGMRGHAGDAGKLLASEFTGANSFIEWFLAVAILGGLSAYRPIRPAANGMLGLTLVAMFIAKGSGFFAQLQSAFINTKAAPATPVAASVGASAGNAINVPSPTSALPADPTNWFGMAPTQVQNLFNPPSISNFSGQLDFPTVNTVPY